LSGEILVDVENFNIFYEIAERISSVIHNQGNVEIYSVERAGTQRKGKFARNKARWVYYSVSTLMAAVPSATTQKSNHGITPKTLKIEIGTIYLAD